MIRVLPRIVTAGLFVGASLVQVSNAFAQSPTPGARGWFDVNFISLQSHQDEQSFTYSRAIAGETLTAAAAYPKLPAARGLGFNGGFNATSRIGFGINFNSVNYESTVGLAARIPHPLFFNRFGADSNVTDSALTRKDRSVDLSLVYSPQTSLNWRVKVFGGPTYFSISQQMVGEIDYDQVYFLNGANIVTLTGFDDQKVTGSSWGFHAGADVSYFFTRFVGVGGVVKLSSGTVTIDEEPLSGKEASFKAGFVTAGLGLRFRF